LTITIARISPLIVLPAWVMVWATITAMYAGTLAGGGGLLPGLVVQVPPHRGGVVFAV